MTDWATVQQKNIIKTYPFRGITLVNGKGSYLYDEKGRKYLDCVTGYGVNIFGHSHPKIIMALKNQLNRLTTLHGSFTSDIRTQAAQALNIRCGGKYQVYFGNSGTESIEAAIKFAAIIKNSKQFISFKGSYHGKSLGALSVSGIPKYKKGFKPLLWDVRLVKYGDKPEFKNALTGKTTAVIIEPIQGENGVRLPPKGFLSFVAELTKKTKTLLIVDEIQTGLGRTGKFLSAEWDRVEADIICLGKGLGAGIPVSATLVHKRYSQKIPKGTHTSTLGGNPLACSGILVTLELLTESQLMEIQSKGKFFLDELRRNLGKNLRVKEIRGKGLMISIEIKHLDQTTILKALQRKFILACPAGDDVIRLLPPFTISKKEIKQVVSLLKEVLNTYTEPIK